MPTKTFYDRLKVIRSEISRFEPGSNAYENGLVLRGCMLGLMDVIMDEVQGPKAIQEARARAEAEEDARDRADRELEERGPLPPPGVTITREPIMNVDSRNEPVRIVEEGRRPQGFAPERDPDVQIRGAKDDEGIGATGSNDVRIFDREGDGQDGDPTPVAAEKTTVEIIPPGEGREGRKASGKQRRE